MWHQQTAYNRLANQVHWRVLPKNQTQHFYNTATREMTKTQRSTPSSRYPPLLCCVALKWDFWLCCYNDGKHIEMALNCNGKWMKLSRAAFNLKWWIWFLWRSRTHDSLSDATDWAIGRMRSVDATFLDWLGLLGSLGWIGTKKYVAGTAT